MNSTATCGANASAFANHPGYRRMFAPDQLTLGIFLPLRFYEGDMAVLAGQAQWVSEIDRLGFAAVWVRDVPLFDPSFGDAYLLPKPVTGRIPLVVTGSSRQSMQWLGEQADGWLTYPDSTHNVMGPRRLAEKIRAWRDGIPGGGLRPHMTNEWIDLADDPDFPRTPMQGGYVLKTGRKGLIDLLGEWREAGVNHAALGIQMAQRPVAEIIEELAQEVLPLFPALAGPEPHLQQW